MKSIKSLVNWIKSFVFALLLFFVMPQINFLSVPGLSIKSAIELAHAVEIYTGEHVLFECTLIPEMPDRREIFCSGYYDDVCRYTLNYQKKQKVLLVTPLESRQIERFLPVVKEFGPISGFNLTYAQNEILEQISQFIRSLIPEACERQ